MIPYCRQHITAEDEAAVLRVLRSDWMSRGPETDALENDLCAVSGATYAVACGSGTMALWLAYTLHHNEYWVIPAITFNATASAAKVARCSVTFRDCDAITGTIRSVPDPSNAVFVTLGGHPAPETWTGIVDGCHGPIHHPANAYATCLSFHPVKHVCAGEGGAVLTNDHQTAVALREIRDAGRRNGRQVRLGTNGHMDEMSAALARSQLTRYHANVATRREIATQYDDAFGMANHQFTPVPHHHESARHLYQILVHRGRRDAVRTALLERGIGTQVHYQPVPHEPWWNDGGSYPGAELHASETLSLPLYPTMTPAEVERVIVAVKEVLG